MGGVPQVRALSASHSSPAADRVCETFLARPASKLSQKNRLTFACKTFQAAAVTAAEGPPWLQAFLQALAETPSLVTFEPSMTRCKNICWTCCLCCDSSSSEPSSDPCPLHVQATQPGLKLDQGFGYLFVPLLELASPRTYWTCLLCCSSSGSDLCGKPCRSTCRQHTVARG